MRGSRFLFGIKLAKESAIKSYVKLQRKILLSLATQNPHLLKNTHYELRQMMRPETWTTNVVINVR